MEDSVHRECGQSFVGNAQDEEKGNQVPLPKIGSEMPVDVKLASTVVPLVKSINKKPVRPSKARPNFFLSVRLDSEAIQEKFVEFSTHVNSKYPEYKKLLIEPCQIHVTLFVFHLGNGEIINQAKECLAKSQDILKETCPDDTFDGRRVVYTSPEETDGLELFTKLTYSLHEKFKKEGLVRGNIREEFKPHATLLKIRKPLRVKSQHGGMDRVIKHIPSEVYEGFKSEHEICDYRLDDSMLVNADLFLVNF
ncbi:15761_t:CDS:2 [Acaulospora colombiana]|uniref:15761_t:CDS:1 n=1 Tax=Acaulospora colombiana TaxID=27376 RepID=A0ACA9NS99_9GLOM|nr:15761_t:CDS:2 [Acaulospora colombiana]